MKIRKCIGVVLLMLMLTSQAIHAREWNPRPNWEDSYAVGGQCYCNSSNYDHNLDEKSAPTPMGVKNVVEICNDIRSVLGEGPTNNRIPYNDIQCGNGPANDAADEAGCPGRVDIGSAGCNMIGPTWNLEAVYGPWPALCNASQNLEPNRWYQLSLPCDVGSQASATVREVLADDLGVSSIGTRWAVFEFTAAGTYQALTLDDEMSTRQGYWLTTLDNGRRIEVSGEPVLSANLPLTGNNATGHWNLVGSFGTSPVSWGTVTLVDSSGSQMSMEQADPLGADNQPVCTSIPFASQCVASRTGYKWTGGPEYDVLTPSSGLLDQFESAWMFVVQPGTSLRVPGAN